MIYPNARAAILILHHMKQPTTCKGSLIGILETLSKLLLHYL